MGAHDGLKKYRRYTRCRHPLCNIPHLREVTFLEVEHHQPWGNRPEGAAHRDEGDHRTDTRRKPPPRDERWSRGVRLLLSDAAVGGSGQSAVGEARTGEADACPEPAQASLARPRARARLPGRPGNPFDTNQAKRCLRTLNMPQKVSARSRSDPGADAFARLRSYLAALRKQGQPLFAALQTVFVGRSFYRALGRPATRRHTASAQYSSAVRCQALLPPRRNRCRARRILSNWLRPRGDSWATRPQWCSRSRLACCAHRPLRDARRWPQSQRHSRQWVRLQ